MRTPVAGTTVKDLVAALQTLPEDLTVYVEHIYGFRLQVVVYGHGGDVVLIRPL